MISPLFCRALLATIIAASAGLAALLASAQQQEMSDTSGQRDAIEVGRRQAELREAINRFGDSDPRILGPLARLGYAFIEASRYEDAERQFLRQAAIVKERFPANHIEVSHPLHHLGETYRRMGRSAEAETLLRQALEMRERLMGPQHEFVGRTAMALAQTLSSLGRFQDAEAMFRRALSVAEVKGAESAEAAAARLAFADFYIGSFRFADAEPLLKSALAIRERTFGTNHRFLPPILVSLGRVYRWTERYGEAEQAVKRALAIREAEYGPEHEFVGHTALELGILYMGKVAIRNRSGSSGGRWRSSNGSLGRSSARPVTR